MGPDKGGSILVHVGTNNAKWYVTTVIDKKYRQLVRRVKQTRVEQIIMSGILPIMGSKGQGYRNCRRFSNYVGKRKLDLWICGDVLLGGLICT